MIFDVRWAVSTLSFQTFLWRDDLCVSPRIGSPPHHHPIPHLTRYSQRLCVQLKTRNEKKLH